MVKRLIFSLGLLVKLALKNKMRNTVKLEMHEQRVHLSTQGQLLSDNDLFSLPYG